MSTAAAAEVLRAYAPAGDPLPSCLAAARRATHGKPAQRARVEEAARVLGLDL